MKKLAIIVGIMIAAVVGIVVPVAAAGTDLGLGVPAGRDVVYSGPPVKGENYYAQGLSGSLPQGMSEGAYRSLMIRSQGLDDLYGLDNTPVVSEKTAGLAQVGESSKSTRQSALISTDDGFNWGDAGVGAAVMLGIGLLAGGVFAANRHGYRVPQARSSS